MGLWQQSHLTVKVLSHRERLMLCRLAIVTLRAPDARFAQSNNVIYPLSNLCAYAQMSLRGNNSALGLKWSM